MADCSAAGTAIDRAARAVMGGASTATTSTAGKHVGALLGHVSMLSVGAANATTVASMPLASPDHLIMPGAMQPLQPPPPPPQQQQQAPLLAQQATTLSRQPEQYPAMMHHPGAAAAQRNLPYQMHHQQQMQHHQHQIQMQLQMQQQQQAMTMMLQQQQQQQLLHRRQQQQQKKQLQKQQQQQQQNSDQTDDWHHGLEDEFLNDPEAANEVLGNAYDFEDVVTGGTSIDQLAAAWAEGEAEYDKLHGGDNTLPLTDHYATRPYEFRHAIDANDLSSRTSISNNKNYMEEGMRHFKEGNISEAIKSFETELQVQNSDNAKAWRMLGKCYAENDQDPQAIQCLEAAVDRDPFCPEALLALGVSYVNELNHERALENMKAWFTHNPKYAGMELPPAAAKEEDIYAAATTDVNQDVTGSHRSAKESAFDEVRRMLLAALEFDPTDAGDVYEALGVIYNVIKDYDAAVDTFRKAIESRPSDHQLWNKLGATLANGGQSEEALPAYHRSIRLKPKYARAWLNMGISQTNLANHDEAARCYLQTLSLNPDATHCWTYLRMSLSSKERWDLLPLVFERNLSGFKEHFDFVLH